MNCQKKCKFCDLTSLEEEQDLYLYAIHSIQFKKLTDTLFSKISFKVYTQSQKFTLSLVIDKRKLFKKNLPLAIHASLYQKYNASQNYFYARDIKAIQSQISSKAFIIHKEYLIYDQNEEYLKRFYYSSEIPEKFRMLGEYYRFHKETARIFQEPFSNIINKYLDKLRKIEYYKITKIIELENKANPNRPPKGIIGQINLWYYSFLGEEPSPLHTVDQKINQDCTTQQQKTNRKNGIDGLSRILKDLDEESNLYYQQKYCNKGTLSNQFRSQEFSVTLQDICENIRFQWGPAIQDIEKDLGEYQQQHKYEEYQKIQKFQNILKKYDDQQKVNNLKDFRITKQMSPSQNISPYHSKNQINLKEGLRSIRQVIASNVKINYQIQQRIKIINK